LKPGEVLGKIRVWYPVLLLRVTHFPRLLRAVAAWRGPKGAVCSCSSVRGFRSVDVGAKRVWTCLKLSIYGHLLGLDLRRPPSNVNRSILSRIPSSFSIPLITPAAHRIPPNHKPQIHNGRLQPIPSNHPLPRLPRGLHVRPLALCVQTRSPSPHRRRPLPRRVRVPLQRSAGEDPLRPDRERRLSARSQAREAARLDTYRAPVHRGWLHGGPERGVDAGGEGAGSGREGAARGEAVLLPGWPPLFCGREEAGKDR
jgi:hypothetical protein